MRRDYGMPRWVKRNVENELIHYYGNSKFLNEIENDILDESSPPSEGTSKTNRCGNPTESKAMRLNTRTLLLAKWRLDGIRKVKEALCKEDQELFELMYRDRVNARNAQATKGIGEDTYYGVKRKIQYLVAKELGYI